MVRLVVSLVFAIFLLIFSSQNMHDVEVRFVFGKPVEMPMILALAGALICGFALATFRFIVHHRRKENDDEGDL